MEKVRVKYEKMQGQVADLDEFQRRQRHREKKLAALVMCSDIDIKQQEEANKRLAALVNRQGNQFVRLEKRHQQFTTAGSVEGATHAPMRLKLKPTASKHLGLVTRLGQDEARRSVAGAGNNDNNNDPNNDDLPDGCSFKDGEFGVAMAIAEEPKLELPVDPVIIDNPSSAATKKQINQLNEQIEQVKEKIAKKQEELAKVAMKKERTT